MSADWYRQKLGKTNHHQTPPPRAVPKYQMGPDGRVYEIDASAPSDPWQQPQPGPPPWQQASHMPSQVGTPIGQTHAGDAIRYWRGTADAQTGAGGCPKCGSPNYFATITAMSETGGESGKLSMGHCMQCGFRNNTGRSYTATPTPQPAGSLRGIKSEDVPVEQARSPYSPEFKGFGIIAKVN